MSKTIGIAGLGWLGKPLALTWQNLGYTVRGTVTSIEKATKFQLRGVTAFPMELSETGVSGEPVAFLKDLHTLVVMIPPGLRRNTGADYVMKMTHFLSYIEDANIRNCIFISSTSVYGDAQGTVTEKDVPRPENEAGRQLLQAEQLFFTSSMNTTIVRFGGLLGGSRQPARYMAGRTSLRGGEAPVNLIHRQDCIGILTEILKTEAYGHIFNAVHPDHPTKKDYYVAKAIELGLDPPEFADASDETYKQVDSVHLKTLLEYQFQSPI